MRTRKVILCFCAVGYVAAVGTVMVCGRRHQPLACLTYLGTEMAAGGRVARFSISNACDQPIDFSTAAIHFQCNGVPGFALRPGFPKGLQPHHTDTLEFTLPAEAKRWRGRVNVSQEKKGIASVPARVRWFLGHTSVSPEWPLVKAQDNRVFLSEWQKSKSRSAADITNPLQKHGYRLACCSVAYKRR
jgi:hypothetical protein